VDALWPWLAVAGSGALHGLNPLCGWLPAAACGARSLRPIVVGHAASIAVVAAMVAISPGMDRRPMLVAAGALLCILLAMRTQARTCAALGAFIAGAMHGTGLMLVPALLPLCIGNSPAASITASGSMLLALAAIGVHLAAMLAVTALLALAVTRGMRSIDLR